MADELVDKGIDAEELDDEGGRPGRRKVWWIAAGVALAGVAGTLAITRPWSNESDDADGSTVVTVARPLDADPVVPELSHQLVFDVVPDEYSISWLNDGEAMPDEFLDGQTSTNVLLVDPEGDISTGPWLAATVTLLDRFERREFDPGMYIMAGDSRQVRVGEYDGAFTDDNFSGHSELIFGPVDDGYVVSLTAEGLTEPEMVAAALELRLDEASDSSEAWPVFGASVAALDLSPLASFAQANSGFGIGAPFVFMLGQSPTSTDVTYADGDDSNGISVINSVAPAGLDVMAIARFVLGDAQDVTVHGLPALRGSFDGGFGGDVVVWVEGGRTVMVAAGGPDLDVLALAESVREAEDDEWAALLEEANDFDGGDLGNGPQDTWLIGVGDAADSTTWIIEGEVDDEGRLSICTTLMRVNESTSGCGGAEAPDLPGLTLVGDFGMGDPTLGYVATIGNDAAATLRFTSETGAVVTTPLKVVRPDWPFQAAALFVEQPGLLEIVGPDGTVLISQEVTQGDLDSGGFG
jgi:hypothetical protein